MAQRWAGSSVRNAAQEAHELEYAILPKWEEEAERIVKGAADVANFAMMIADNSQRETSCVDDDILD